LQATRWRHFPSSRFVIGTDGCARLIAAQNVSNWNLNQAHCAGQTGIFRFRQHETFQLELKYLAEGEKIDRIY